MYEPAALWTTVQNGERQLAESRWNEEGGRRGAACERGGFPRKENFTSVPKVPRVSPVRLSEAQQQAGQHRGSPWRVAAIHGVCSVFLGKAGWRDARMTATTLLRPSFLQVIETLVLVRARISKAAWEMARDASLDYESIVFTLCLASYQ